MGLRFFAAFELAEIKLALRVIHQPLDIGAMTPDNGSADAGGDDPQLRLSKAGEDHKQRQHDGGGYGADGD